MVVCVRSAGRACVLRWWFVFEVRVVGVSIAFITRVIYACLTKYLVVIDDNVC